jgi:hypothetical protein
LKAVKRLVHRSGFSVNMAEAMMDAIFSELTEPKLWKLLESELKNPQVLDDFKHDPGTKTWLRARGPGTLLHIFSANVPQAAILSFILGMLLKSRNVGKLSSRDEGFLDIYLRSLKNMDCALGKTNALIDPKNRTAFLTFAKKADAVVAYGSDKSLDQIRKQIPSTTLFFAYGHRVSIALYAKEILNDDAVRSLARLAARDVWMADQRGCLSPLTLYVQMGGSVSPDKFAGQIAAELQRLSKSEKILPRRDLSMAVAAYGLRSRFFLKKIKGVSSEFWESRPRGLWAVVYDENLKPFLAGSSQMVFIKGYKKIDRVYSAISPLQKYLQCAALECAPTQRKKISEKLSKLGINRICHAGRMQLPPITWHHDGRPNLASWVHWTDLEG